MKIVIIGGTGLIGKKLAARLSGHEVVIASPSRGVNTLTGEGLAEALAGAQVVVDVSNAPSWEDDAVLHFFQTSQRNLGAAEKAAGVGHHVALSVVGIERLPGSGYFRAKVAQEELIRASGIPFTIARATQFFEFIEAIAQAGTSADGVRVSSAKLQPIAADDVAAALADLAVGAPLHGMVELAGPDALPLPELVGMHLGRPVSGSPDTPYFGTLLDDRSLTPGANPRLGPTRYADWLKPVPA